MNFKDGNKLYLIFYLDSSSSIGPEFMFISELSFDLKTGTVQSPHLDSGISSS